MVSAGATPRMVKPSAAATTGGIPLGTPQLSTILPPRGCYLFAMPSRSPLRYPTRNSEEPFSHSANEGDLTPMLTQPPLPSTRHEGHPFLPPLAAAPIAEVSPRSLGPRSSRFGRGTPSDTPSPSSAFPLDTFLRYVGYSANLETPVRAAPATCAARSAANPRGWSSGNSFDAQSAHAFRRRRRRPGRDRALHR
jgi:hypothetical protein